jgi:hypothetical protein
MLDSEIVGNKIRFAESMVREAGIRDAGATAALTAILDVLKEIANALDHLERMQSRRAA